MYMSRKRRERCKEGRRRNTSWDRLRNVFARSKSYIRAELKGRGKKRMLLDRIGKKLLSLMGDVLWLLLMGAVVTILVIIALFSGAKKKLNEQNQTNKEK